MDKQRVENILAEPRNGCNEYYRHALCRNFVYTDGVKELAEEGCYWMLDVIGTELVPKYIRNRDWSLVTVHFNVSDGKGRLYARIDDEGPDFWSKSIDFTDFPHGKWLLFFMQSYDGACANLILPGEY